MRLLVLAGLLSSALAIDITVSLPAKPNPFSLPPTTYATLSTLGKHHSAPLSTVNTFVFHNVTAESYLVDVLCPSHAYAPLRLDVNPDGSVEAWETYRGNEWGNKGEALTVRDGGSGKGVEVRSLGPKNYFMERPKFSVLSILKNPMILMGIVSMAIFIGMPYMMDNMDPELRAEFEEQQRQGGLTALLGGGGSGGAAKENPIQNFDMAAYLAGSKSKDGGNGGSGGSGNKAQSGGSAKSQGVRR